MMHYLQLALTYVLALVVYWELLEIRGREIGSIMTALRVMPVIIIPPIAFLYMFWYYDKTGRKNFKKPINIGVAFITIAYGMYHL